jgi:hypothetical protein
MFLAKARIHDRPVGHKPKRRPSGRPPVRFDEGRSKTGIGRVPLNPFAPPTLPKSVGRIYRISDSTQVSVMKCLRGYDAEVRFTGVGEVITLGLIWILDRD